MKGKVGISAIVATVLVILITVAGVGIIWVAIVPMISESIAFEGMEGRVSIVSTGGYTVYDATRDIAIVQVKRDVDDGVMDRIKISFIIDGNSVSSNVVAPGSGQTKTYNFDLVGYGEPEGVGVAPIFVSGSGKEKEGSVSSVEISGGEINDEVVESVEFKAEMYDLEEEYYGDYSELPSDGLVSWWRFDGDVNDSVGGNDGSFVDDAYINENGELVLDGASDWVHVDNDGGLSVSNEISISFWADIRNGIVVSGGTQYGVFIDRSGSSKRVRYWYWGGNPNWLSFYTDYGVVPFSGWNHIVVTNIPGVGVSLPKIYVNGVEQTVSGNVQSNNVGGTGSRIRIGEYSIYEPYSPVNGLLDDVMIFDRALSPEEIITIYDVQKGVGV